MSVDESKGSLGDAGMDPNDAARKRARVVEQESREESKAKADTARVLNEMEQKHGRGNMEPTEMSDMDKSLGRLPQAELDLPPNRNPQIAAGMTAFQTPEEMQRETYEQEERETLNPDREAKNPIILAMMERQQKKKSFLGLGRARVALEGESSRIKEQLRKHEITGVSKPRAVFNLTKTALINSGTKDLARRTGRTLGNIGESALVERTRPQITEKIAFNDRTGRYEKTIDKTWTERNPYSHTDYSSSSKQAFQNNNWVTIERERITSKTRSPITAKERQKYAMNFKDVLNGAKIDKELSGLRDITHGGTTGYGLGGLVGNPAAGLRSQFGIQPINVRSQPSSRPAPSKIKKGRKTSGHQQITASEMRAVTGRGGGRGAVAIAQPTYIRAPQPIRATPQPMPALQAQNATGFENYTPDSYSPYGQSYRNQVSRWVGGRPHVVGFLNPNEQPLAWNLIRAQQKMNIGTGVNPWNPNILRPTLSQQALKEEAGLTHSTGPSHDFGNQIFNPSYGFYRLRGNGQLGNTDVFGMFMGRRPLTRQVGPIIQVTRAKGKNGKVTIKKIGGPR